MKAVLLRLPDELHAELRERAWAERMSMNAYVIRALGLLEGRAEGSRVISQRSPVSPTRPSFEPEIQGTRSDAGRGSDPELEETPVGVRAKPKLCVHGLPVEYDCKQCQGTGHSRR